MRFPNCFSGEKREIYVKGEVYLEVARDEEHPFVVYAGENEVRVLGTRFNLTAYPDEQKVSRRWWKEVSSFEMISQVFG